MYASNLSTSGLTTEQSQSGVEYPHQGIDFWTMKADKFFEWLEENNKTKPLPKGFILKPIRYDMVRKCRIVTKVK